MLKSRLGSPLAVPMEREMDSMGRRAWVNPAYSGSPPLSPFNISAVYRPGGPLDNPYEGRCAPASPVEDPYSGTYTPGPQDSVRLDSEGQKQNKKGRVSGCCASICRGICGLWGTTLTKNTKQNQELHIRTSLRELLIYIMFLLDLCLLTYGMSSSSAFYYTNTMMGLFVNAPTGLSFQSITSMNDFWTYVQGPLLDGLYWTTWYNNEPLQSSTYSFITYDNLLLGVPRMRQLKVMNNSCTIYKDFQKDITGCFDVYDEKKEDSSQFGLVNGTAWTYHTAEELKGSPHWGLLATYSGGGYYQDLWLTRNLTAAILQQLMDNLWLDRGTRVVFIDFSTYNANLNLFCVIRLVVEFPATGGAIPSYQFRTVKLIRYISTWDYFIFGCEVVFCIFILYYIVEEFLELRIHKLSYFTSIWNILDIVIILLSVIAIAFNIFRTVKVNALLGNLLNKPEMYIDLEFLAFWQTQYNNMNAVNLFFAWIKIFKYISFNKTMSQLSSTLGRCAKDIMGFAIMFFIVFFAYAQLGYLLFGTQVQNFSTFVKCIFTQFRIILGDFDFDAIETANRVLGPIYFVTFVFFVFFVLLNMFLAIINDTYSEVKEELSNHKDEFQFTDIIKQSYLKTFMKLTHKKEKISDVQKALQSGSTELEYEDFRDTLKEMGHTDHEISAAFSKFDKDGNRVLDQDEQNRMKQELKEKRDALNAELHNLGRSYGDKMLDKDDVKNISPVSQEEFQRLARQVLQLEQSMATVMSNIKQECQDGLRNKEDRREDERSSPDGNVLRNFEAAERAKMVPLDTTLLGRRDEGQHPKLPQHGWAGFQETNSKGQTKTQL